MIEVKKQKTKALKVYLQCITVNLLYLPVWRETSAIKIWPRSIPNTSKRHSDESRQHYQIKAII